MHVLIHSQYINITAWFPSKISPINGLRSFISVLALNCVKIAFLGGNPGLVVMGEDSCSEGRVRISAQYTGWTWHFSRWFVVKLYCLFENTENKQKRGRGWLVFKKLPLYRLYGNNFRLNSLIRIGHRSTNLIGLWGSHNKIIRKFETFDWEKVWAQFCCEKVLPFERYL